MFEQCLPEDLMQYGLIPEFIGRLPVTSAVHQLSRDDLITILTEPRNAIVKQFQRFFGFDGIELVFSDDALKSVADKALERETGARGLRSIIEEVLLEVQFELPSRRDVKKCVVTKETVERGLKPTLVTEAPADERATRPDAGQPRTRRRLQKRRLCALSATRMACTTTAQRPDRWRERGPSSARGRHEAHGRRRTCSPSTRGDGGAGGPVAARGAGRARSRRVRQRGVAYCQGATAVSERRGPRRRRSARHGTRRVRRHRACDADASAAARARLAGRSATILRAR